MLSGLASFEPGQFLFDSAVFEPEIMKTEELSAIISVFIGSRQTFNECAFCSMLSEPRYQDLCLAPHSDDLQVIHEKRDRIRVKDEIRVKPLESREWFDNRPPGDCSW